MRTTPLAQSSEPPDAGYSVRPAPPTVYWGPPALLMAYKFMLNFTHRHTYIFHLLEPPCVRLYPGPDNQEERHDRIPMDTRCTGRTSGRKCTLSTVWWNSGRG